MSTPQLERSFADLAIKPAESKPKAKRLQPQKTAPKARPYIQHLDRTRLAKLAKHNKPDDTPIPHLVAYPPLDWYDGPLGEPFAPESLIQLIQHDPYAEALLPAEPIITPTLPPLPQLPEYLTSLMNAYDAPMGVPITSPLMLESYRWFFWTYQGTGWYRNPSHTLRGPNALPYDQALTVDPTRGFAPYDPARIDSCRAVPERTMPPLITDSML